MWSGSATAPAYYYTVNHRDKGPRIYLHVLATDPSIDRAISGKVTDRELGRARWSQKNGRYMLIVVQWGWQKTEWFFRDLARMPRCDR